MLCLYSFFILCSVLIVCLFLTLRLFLRPLQFQLFATFHVLTLRDSRLTGTANAIDVKRETVLAEALQAHVVDSHLNLG